MLIKSSLQIQMRGRVGLISSTSWCCCSTVVVWPCWSRLSSRWIQNLQLIIETCSGQPGGGARRSQNYRSFIGSPTVLWTMFFFMSLSFFLLTLFSNLWIAPGHKSMWIRHLAYFKILATYTTIERPTHRIFPLDCQSHRFIHTATAWWQTLALSPG